MKKHEKEIEFLNQFIKDIEIEFTIDNYYKILEGLIEFKFSKIEKNILNYPNYNNYSGAFVKLNTRSEKVLYKNVVVAEFSFFYPEILYNIINNYTFNYKKFPYCYKAIYNIYKYISLINTSYDYKLKEILKRWLIITYGKLGSLKSYIYSNKDIRFDILNISNSFMEKLKYKYDKEIFYIDTDAIYFKYDQNIINDITNFNYDYKLRDIDNILFLSKKRYITFDNDSNVKVYGLRAK